MNAPKFDADKHPAMVQALEGLAMLMMVAGATKEQAINGAARLFSAAHAEATLYELECALLEADSAE
jgi:hypothetical protein